MEKGVGEVGERVSWGGKCEGLGRGRGGWTTSGRGRSCTPYLDQQPVTYVDCSVACYAHLT